MKRWIISCLCAFAVSALGAQEKIELTKVDLFSQGKLPPVAQISVMGVSVGDSFDEALAKLGKSRKNVDYNGTVHTLDIGKEECRYISRDNKVVTSIILFPDFKKRAVGKTAEYFDLLSAERMKSFLTQSIGSPEYIYELELMGWVSYIYPAGFCFRRFGSNNIAIEDQFGIEEEIKNESTKKLADYDRPVAKPAKSSSAGFRSALWGMTKEEVKKTETSEFFRADRLDGDMAGLDLLAYKTDALGMSAVIGYYFAGNALTRARYIILDSHSDYNLYIRDFEKIKEQLTGKYGAPERDQKMWSNELFKDDPDKYGVALASGHVIYVAEWYPTETGIQLLMRGDNYKVGLHVEYTGEKYKEYEKDVIKRAKKNIW